MSPVTSPVTDFERNARLVLEESASRVDARTRSRLNQARQLAVEAVGVRHRPWWRSSTAAVEDIDLLADAEALDLVEGWDGPGPGFYEWAADETDANVQSTG